MKKAPFKNIERRLIKASELLCEAGLLADMNRLPVGPLCHKATGLVLVALDTTRSLMSDPSDPSEKSDPHPRSSASICG